MAQIVILPGFSPTNKSWSQKMQQHLAKLGKVQTVEWIHWQTGQASKNWPEAELAKIEVLVKQPVVIVAKSIGTIIAVKFIAADPKLVDAVVLCGIPVNA